MKVMFLDESGDHNLSVIDPHYPIFVLGGVILEKEYAEGELTQRLESFKKELFGNDQIILHTSDIARNRNGFERVKEPEFRARFFNELNKLMESLNFKVVGCAIRKDEHLSRYGVAALDPYMMSLDILVERFCFEIGNSPAGGMIVAEKRNPTLDHELDLAWLNLKIQGTAFIKAKTIEERIVGLTTRNKKENIAGMQLADLVVSPLGRFVLGKKIKDDFKIIENKLRRDWKGDYWGIGLVVLPKTKK
jgi:hypothetical protein